MNPSFCLIHWPGRGRYDFRELHGSSYRPRPDNGSGDSPRPPFLTEFVNHIGKLALVHVIYHLIGGQLGLRVHPHVERSFRLKTKAARGVGQLQAAYAEVSENAVDGRRPLIVGNICKRTVYQFYLRPVAWASLVVDHWSLALVFANDRRRTTDDQFFPRDFQRCRILIEPDQMSRCAEAFCDFVAVPAKAHRGVDISPATPDG